MARNLICGTHALQDHTWSGWFCVGDRQQPFEMPLIQDDHVIKQVASATSHPALRNTVLPRTAKDRSSWLAPHVLHSRNHLGSKLCVAVEWQESVRLFVGPCFSQLPYNPKRMGISRHIEAQDLTPVVADNEKAVQNTKREHWDGEEVHRSNGLTMVSEERQPSFHRIWISRGSPDPSRDTPFRDIETQLEQFAVNTRLCCAKIPFSFEVDRYNGQPANNRLTFIYALLPEKEPPAIVGLETAVEMKLVRLELCATVVQVDGNCSV